MSFTNLTLDVNNIPAVEAVPLQPIARDYKKVMLLRWVLLWIFISVAFLILVFGIEVMPIGIPLLIISILLMMLAIFNLVTRNLSFKKMSYAIREHDVIFKKGWFVQTLGVCPTKKIQHCKISSDVFERMYGLATLSFYTAGSSGADMKIAGLTKEEAEKIRTSVMTKLAEYEQ